MPGQDYLSDCVHALNVDRNMYALPRKEFHSEEPVLEVSDVSAASTATEWPT